MKEDFTPTSSMKEDFTPISSMKEDFVLVGNPLLMEPYPTSSFSPISSMKEDFVLVGDPLLMEPNTTSFFSSSIHALAHSENKVNSPMKEENDKCEDFVTSTDQCSVDDVDETESDGAETIALFFTMVTSDSQESEERPIRKVEGLPTIRANYQETSENEDSTQKESLTTPEFGKVNENESSIHERILTIHRKPPDITVSRGQIISPDIKVS